VDKATDPESKPKSSALDCELGLELEPLLDVDPLAWTGWLARASRMTARKPAAAAATALFFAPATRRRASSIREGEPAIR
jgi:hypothetical protein